jgi:hypothetical protein
MWKASTPGRKTIAHVFTRVAVVDCFWLGPVLGNLLKSCDIGD